MPIDFWNAIIGPHNDTILAVFGRLGGFWTLVYLAADILHTYSVCLFEDLTIQYCRD